MQELRKDVGRDGVRPEDQEGIEEAGMAGASGTFLAQIDYQETESKQQQAEATGKENIGTGPQLLVDGEREIPEGTEKDAGEARCGDSGGLSDFGRIRRRGSEFDHGRACVRSPGLAGHGVEHQGAGRVRKESAQRGASRL